MSEPKSKFPLPRIGARMVKTMVSVAIVLFVYHYLWNDRNPCFACIGAVYGLGMTYHAGMSSGGNRFVGTLLGGLCVIPFYWLVLNRPLGIPVFVFQVVGLLVVMYLNLLCGAPAAIQPATVVYFVVMFTVTPERYVSYTLARILDTGIGVVLSLLINRLFPSPHEPVPAAPAHAVPLTTGEAMDEDAEEQGEEFLE